jgi:hypothetical protein
MVRMKHPATATYDRTVEAYDETVTAYDVLREYSFAHPIRFALGLRKARALDLQHRLACAAHHEAIRIHRAVLADLQMSRAES